MAIKVIQKTSVSGQKVLEKLMSNELKILEDISHPNVVKIYELLHDDNNYYIVSELIKYGELQDYVVERQDCEEGALTEEEVIKVTKQIFQTLNFMHN